MSQTDRVVAFLKEQDASEKSAREITTLARKVEDRHHRKPFHVEWKAAGVTEIGMRDFEPDYREK